MDDIYIHSKEQWESWCDERKRHDPDFDGDAYHWLYNNKFPFRVIWCDTESNGYPDVRYIVEDIKN